MFAPVRLSGALLAVTLVVQDRPCRAAGERATIVQSDDDATLTEATLAELRMLPRPPSLPDLTHEAAEASFGQATAALLPKGGADPRTAHLLEADVEVPLSRWLYVGGTWGAAGARGVADDSLRVVAAQPEAWARVVSQGLGSHYTLGAGLGVLPPLFTYDGLDDATRLARGTTSALVGIVRPWDVVQYFDRRVTLRPWIDLRTSRRHLLAQLRGRLDFAFRTSAPPDDASGVPASAGDLELYASAALFLGWRPTKELSLGLEAWEAYLLRTSLPLADRDRVTFALSPSVRFHFARLEPAISVLVPLGPPMLGVEDGYLALRVDVRVWLEKPPR